MADNVPSKKDGIELPDLSSDNSQRSTLAGSSATTSAGSSSYETCETTNASDVSLDYYQRIPRHEKAFQRIELHPDDNVEEAEIKEHEHHQASPSLANKRYGDKLVTIPDTLNMDGKSRSKLLMVQAVHRASLLTWNTYGSDSKRSKASDTSNRDSFLSVVGKITDENKKSKDEMLSKSKSEMPSTSFLKTTMAPHRYDFAGQLLKKAESSMSQGSQASTDQEPLTGEGTMRTVLTAEDKEIPPIVLRVMARQIHPIIRQTHKHYSRILGQRHIMTDQSKHRLSELAHLMNQKID